MNRRPLAAITARGKESVFSQSSGNSAVPSSSFPVDWHSTGRQPFVVPDRILGGDWRESGKSYRKHC